MAFTKVVGPGIHTLSNILSHNINSSGIITATKFVGPFDGTTIGGGTTISSDGINVTGIVTATGLDINGNGDISGNLVIGGNLTANGDFTTLNTTLREVELLRVDASDSNLTAGIITQRGTGDILNLFDTSTEVLTVKDGGNVGIGTETPQTILHLHDSTDTRIQITDNGTGAASGDGVLVGLNGDDDFFINNRESGKGLKFFTGSDDLRLHIDSDGVILMGGNSSRDVGFTHKLQLEDTGNTPRAISIVSNRNSAHASHIDFAKSRGSTLGSNTIVQDDDFLGHILFRGADGTDLAEGAAKISGAVDGTPGSNNIPGRLEFYTSTGGSSYKRLTIDSSGRFLLNHDSSRAVANVTAQVQLEGTTASTSAISITRNSASAYPPYLNFGKSRATSTGGTTIIQDDDSLGQIRFSGADGNDLTNHAASIEAFIDGTPGNNVTPGRLIFSTTSATGSDATEKFRISSNGQVCIGSGFVGGGGQLTIRGLGVNNYAVQDYQYIGTPSDNTTLAQIRFTANTSGASVVQGAVIKAVADAAWSTSGDAPTRLEFHTVPDGSASMENRMTITKDGQVIIDGTENLGHPNMDDIVVGDGSGNRGITIASGTSNFGTVAFGDSNDGSGSDRYQGYIEYYHQEDYFTFYTSTSRRLRIDSDGIDVTGEVSATQDYPNFRPVLDFNFAATKKLKPEMTFTRQGEASYHDGVGSVKFVGDNEPRFEHDILTGECKGLMFEQAGTNYSWYSRRFDVVATASWVKVGSASITANTHTAPDGTSSGIYMADTISGADGTTFNGNVLRQQITAGANVKHTFSIYIKLITSTQATIYVRDGATGSTASANAVNTKTWQRVVVTSNNALTNATTHSFYVGNTNGDIAVWGAQIERSDYVSSYIKTEGGVNGTRVADASVQLDGEDFTDAFNDGKGTLIAEFIPTISLSNQVIVGLHQDFGTNNRIEVRSMGNNAANARFESVVSGSSVVSNNTLAHAGINNVSKYAFAVEKDNYAMCVNGSTVATDTSGAFPPGIDSMIIGDSSYGVNSSMIIKRIMYYADRLPNSQLVTLTS